MRRTIDAKDVIANRVSFFCRIPGIAATPTGVTPLRKQFPVNLEIVHTSADNSDRCIMECVPLKTDNEGNVVDNLDRQVILKGINVDASMKLPVEPHFASYEGNSSDPDNLFYDGDIVSFVGRPFPIEEAKEHFTRIKSWGFNTIRYILTWEAIEHTGPGNYDDEFVDYTIEILKIIHDLGGLYVFLEFHQDVWSRYCGGSGAPLWTLYAAGLNPKNFPATEAAILHNEARFHGSNPEKYHKMLWTSNYKRLACYTMFTLLFAGKNYFPNFKINGENIQDYLQNHLFNCMAYIWKAVVEKLPHMIKDGTIIGFESMNEPNWGLIGHEDLNIIPNHQQLRVGTTPTAYQALKLGMGFACEVDVYKISITGPQKYDTKLIDPKGVKAWISPEEGAKMDKKYGWTRSKEWKLGTCIFSQLGIWSWKEELEFSNFPIISEEARRDIAENKCFLLKPDFFHKPDENFVSLDDSIPEVVDMDYFLNNNFVDFYLNFKKAIRDIEPSVFLLIQPPVLELPPSLKGDPRNVIDDRTIYAPHYYDGMSLMFKTWNTKYNVDTLGIMRGKYLNPVLGIVFGERAIRNCITGQFKEIKEECKKYLGLIPVLMSETGMPFDMDKKKAYENGRFYSQTGALDALSYALEGLQMHHTYWCYASVNCHEWGDRWNNEDFSFWSPDDRNIVEERKSRFDLPYSTRSSSRNISLTRIKTKVQDIKKRTESRRNSLASFVADSVRRASLSGTYPSPTKIAIGEINNNSVPPKSPLQFNPRFTSLEDYKETASPESSPLRNRAVLRETRHDSITSTNTTSLNFYDENDILTLSGSSIITTNSENIARKHTKRCYPSPDGVRAVNAVIRPYMMASKGRVTSTSFDLKSCKFSLSLMIDLDDLKLSNAPTIIFVPKWHFPLLNYGDISVTNGYVKYNREFEYIEWYHNDLVRTTNGRAKSEASSESDKSLLAGEIEAVIIIKNDSGGITDVDVDEEGSILKAKEQFCPIT
jgi:hypothetical protein